MGETWWTTEQVMEYLGVSRQAVYDSRARNKFPGNRGHRRSKRLLFPAEEIERGRAMIEAGEDPDPIEETADVALATLWQLQAIHKTLRAIYNELRAQRPVWVELVTEETTEITIEIEEEE